MTINAHPLQWPEGWKRTEAARRRQARFSKAGQRTPSGWRSQRDLTMTGAAGGYSTREKSLRLSIARRKTAKLEGKEDAANRIRTDPRPSALVAPEYGISQSMVRKIRRNAAWRDISTPFAGLLR